MKPNIIENAVCPFCGLACDDLKLTVDKLNIQAPDTLPDYCRNSYLNASMDQEPTCLVKGKKVSLDKALAHSAELLKNANLPLFSGLATDVNGARAILQIARRCGAVVDHKTSPVTLRNTQVIQDEGWVNCTLSEARNRADMIIVLGTVPLQSFPRLVERLVPPELGNFQDRKPEWVLIGPWHQEKNIPSIIRKHQYRVLPLEKDQLNDCPRILNTLLNTSASFTDNQSDNNEWQQWFNRLLACRFSVFTWSASEYSHFALQSLAKFLKQMNQKTRCVGLPMSGSYGDSTFHQVSTWQNGAPARISFAGGNTKYDPLAYDSSRMLEQKTTDLLIWVSPLDSSPIPKTDIPTILIGHPATAGQTDAEVFIPAGIPGIDHEGHIFRTDSVASLMLKKIRNSKLKSVPELLKTLEEQLNTKQ